MTDSELINEFSNAFVDNFWTLEFGIAPGCRCLSCWEFIVKHDDEIIAHDTFLRETMERALKTLSNNPVS